MATKAEEFRYWTERSGPKKRKTPPAATRGVLVEETLTARGSTHAHEPLRAGKKAMYALEDSAGKPSRKSTRKASNRQRTDAQMRVKRRTAEVRPPSAR